MAKLNIHDYFIECAKGNVPNTEVRTVFGHNPDLDAAAQEDLWEQGGTLTYLSSAETLNIASTSTADDGDPAGTGARTLRLTGLDANYSQITEDITLNGTTNVLTTNAYLRVSDLRCLTAGSVGTNAGIITATASASATVQGIINVLEGVGHNGFYTVPADRTAYLLFTDIASAKIVGGGSPEIVFKMYQRNIGSNGENAAWLLSFERAMDTSVENFYQLRSPTPDVLPSKTDLRFSATTNTNNTDISASAYILEVKNGY